MTAIEHGMFEWADLSTPDVEGAQTFYGAVLGWSFRTSTTDMGDYTIASVDDREVAGMMPPPPGAESPPRWTEFVRVADVDATLDALAGAGGVVRAGPFEVPGGARVAVCADRTGAEFALIGDGPEPEGEYYAETPGAVCWVELMTSDVPGAVDFYHRVFGWSAETDSSGPVPYTVFRLDGREVAGMIGRPDHVPPEVPDGWSVYFTVSDCAAAESLACAHGGQVVLPATPTPAGPFAVLADPSGAAFEIMQIEHGTSAGIM